MAEHPQEVVEAVARRLWSHDLSGDWEDAAPFEHADYLACAKDCLDAIDASGYWIAPDVMTPAMADAWRTGLIGWDTLRDACLSERKTGTKGN